ncbi:MAG: polysaccharide biosynthesis/export family protein [Prevotella sp.]|nr:polysaccharide biosynthesis/export family protein [Prevotella sp.]
MKNNNFKFLFVSLLVILTSCGSSEKIIYLQGADTLNMSDDSRKEVRIMPGDELTITVNTTDPDAAKPFNLMVGGGQGMVGNNSDLPLRYLVDRGGNIIFPLVGTLHVAGLTIRACEQLVSNNISPYLSSTEHPVVTVSMSNFNVTVLGEVKNPGTLRVSHDRISILEAIAQAGDLTMYGKRNNVMLIRIDEKGRKSIHRVDLTDGRLLKSPLYYLQQNDVVYVEQNKTKINSTKINSVSIWFTVFSFLASITSLIVNIVK